MVVVVVMMVVVAIGYRQVSGRGRDGMGLVAEDAECFIRWGKSNCDKAK
jgi:hypothetical protein